MTDLESRVIADRQARRELELAGYEEVGESGGKLWELTRGSRFRHRIVDVKIDAGGKSLWIKTSE